MKKLIPIVMALSLAGGSAAIAFGQQAPPQKDAKSDSSKKDQKKGDNKDQKKGDEKKQ